ncbi:MAG: D-arabinono-1,4-lactone oxidase [Myxococcota bacterium]
MPVQSFIAALKTMQQAPTEANAEALFAMLRKEPDLADQAKPQLVSDPAFAAAYRVAQPGADFQYHNTNMPMPRAIKRPTNLDTLVATVQGAADQFRALKAMGEGWGFANTSFTPDWLVHCADLDSVLPLEDDLFGPNAPAKGDLVRFEAGITFEKLNQYLDGQGRALMQQPGFAGLTFLGCSAMGGHGSGLGYTGLSGYIEAIELVTLDSANRARVLRIEPTKGLVDRAKWAARYPAPRFDLVQDDALFHTARCAQGNVGIVYAVTVRTQPAYFLNETRVFMPWSQAWPQVQGWLNHPAVHSLHVWINPYHPDPTVLVTKLTRTAQHQRAGARGIGILLGGMNPFTEAVRLFVATFPQALPTLMDSALKSCQASDVSMPSYEALDFGAPNTIPVHAASLGFDAAKLDQVFPALMKELNDWTKVNQWVSSPIGLRWVKASEDYLSPQYGRDTVMLEMPIMKGTPNATDTLDRYANYMMDTWGARPHWGQLNPMTPTRFQNAYAGAWQKFVPGYRTLNPNGFFDGPFAKQIGLRELANAH